MRRLLPLLPLLLLPDAALAQVRPDAVMLRDPDVSATEVVFRYAGDLWLVPKSGGVARRLTTADGNEAFPRFSPDGTQVAFLGGYDGGHDLYVLDVAAGVPRRVTFHPAQEILCGWTPDGGLLYWSSEVASLARAARIMRVDAAGGQPEPLPVPYGTFAALDETGCHLAYTPYSREFRTWKRYRGGFAGDVWLYDLETGDARNLTDDPANDELPMWHGSEVLFRSDREGGVHNLFSYDVETNETRQLTFFDAADVKFPSAGPTDVVFENGGRLYVLDLVAADRPYRPIDVVIPGERPQLRPRRYDVSDDVETVSAGPGGVRAAVEARGDVWSVPYEKGVAVNLTASSGVAERAPSWSPDGRFVAYLSDRSGEYEVVLRRADGKPFDGSDEHGEKRLTSMGPGWKSSLGWSPDSSKLWISTSHGELLVLAVEGGEPRSIHVNPEGFPLDPDWSPDSRWLAWSHRHPESRLDAIYLHDLESGETHVVTSGMFNDSSPTFDRSGELLYFTSSRTFDPIYGELDGTWIYADTVNACYVPLRADVEDPFAPEDPQEEVEGEAEDDGKDGEPKEADEEAGDEDEKDEAEKEGEDDPAQDGEEEDAVEPVEIEIEGFERRVRVLPLPAGRYAGLIGAGRKVVFLRLPGAGDEEDGQATLGFLDLDEDDEEKRVQTILAGEVRGAQLVADGEKLAVQVGGELGVVALAPDQELKAADLSGLVALVDPREEWPQILTDAWRLYRDFFYDPGMHGLDWDAVGRRYRAALEDATSRDDVHWLIGEMIAELNVGHAYNDAPDDGMERTPPARPTGLLGCDWTLEDGAYRIARIYDGGYDADARSPLARAGGAREGDFLLAVNGVPVDPTQAVHAAFVGTAGRPTAITLCAAPRADGTERVVVVEPLSDETELRYRAWVAETRRGVDEASGGRVGYVHVPDTGVHGQNELVRQFLGQMHKDALLVDERWNGGGQIPDRFVELLDRPLLNQWAVRAGEDWTWPRVGHFGPKAMLINFAAGSGGDCFPYYFRQRGLGPLIGTRTWGGLVGISGNPSLIDGSQPTVPRFAFYELDGTWGVEGYGVAPDVEVIDDPSLHRPGELDPQVQAAVDYLLGELETWTSPRPSRPEGAIRTGTGVRPEDR